jgi:hypothetical protein
VVECCSVAFSLLEASWEGEASPLDCERQGEAAEWRSRLIESQFHDSQTCPFDDSFQLSHPWRRAGHQEWPSQTIIAGQNGAKASPNGHAPEFRDTGFLLHRLAGRGAAEIVTLGADALGHVPGDVNGLAARITELAASPELRARLGRAARLTAERSFDSRTSRPRSRADLSSGAP